MDTTLITVAFILGYLAYRIGLPPLVGFLAAGLGLNLFGYTAPPGLETLADIGVTLLLFTIGLKLNLKSLIKPEVFGAATIHMGLSVIVLGTILFFLAQTGLQFFLGLSLQTAMLVAFGLSFSSTVYAVKALEELGRMDSLTGRVAIGVLVIQDIVAVLYITISAGEPPSWWALLVFALLPLCRKVFMKILDKVGHGELQVLFGLVLALAAGAATFKMVGLKADLGALILGILLAPHPRAKEIAKSLLSIKDLLLVGFFVDIGLAGIPGVSGMIAAAVMVVLIPIKLFFYFVLFTRFKLRARTSFATTMTLANYSEFGLIVCYMASASGHLDSEWLVVMAIALSISLVLVSIIKKFEDDLFDRYQKIFKKFETKNYHVEELPLERGNWEVVIVGMGRIGVGAYDVFQEKFGNVVLGIDFDPKTIASQEKLGRSVRLGDITDPDYWRKLPFGEDPFKLVVLAMPCLEAKLYAAKMMKELGYKGEVAAVAQFDDEIISLKDAGVSIAFNMYSEAGIGLASHICHHIETNGNQTLDKL